MIRGVVLVVIDCLRADHVSAYGYHRPTTPTMDELARTAFLWRSAYSACSWTKPSITSLMTGLYPSQHRVLRGPKRSRGRVGAVTDVLSPAHPTLAEAFSKAGWRCAAFLNNVQLEEYTGLNRGFDAYLPNICGVDRQLETLDEWLRTRSGEPFFVYLHLMEAHWPYKPRRRHVALFGGDRDASKFSNFSARDFAKLRNEISRGEVSLMPSDVEDLVRMYDAAVRRLDGKLKALLKILENHKVLATTAITITADHGEELLDHGSLGHGRSLHVESVHVPLILRLPDATACTDDPAPVSLVDLPKTLLLAAGIDAAFPGHDLTSLHSPRSLAYSELVAGRRYARSLRSGRWSLHRCVSADETWNFTMNELMSRAAANELPQGETVQLFDLASDPHEHVDGASEPGSRCTVDRLTHEMSRCIADSRRPVDESGIGEVEVDSIVVQRLRALGYIE